MLGIYKEASVKISGQSNNNCGLQDLMLEILGLKGVINISHAVRPCKSHIIKQQETNTLDPRQYIGHVMHCHIYLNFTRLAIVNA